MRFETVPLAEAAGCLLAHAVRQGGLALKKGHRLSAADIDRLRAAGLASVIAAQLDADDVHEDAAAARVAAAVMGNGLLPAPAFTGRVNLLAETDGLLVVDPAGIDAMNRVHEAITVATLPAFAAVCRGDMAATVKIIPFAAPEAALSAVERSAVARAVPPLWLAPWRLKTAALVQTRLPGTTDKVLDKTHKITADRLARVAMRLDAERRTDHRPEVLAEAVSAAMADGPDLLLIAGASAITDRADVLPAAIERAGGEVAHFGMPVDPGNLLLLARIGETPVLGLPGCARSPKLNGFDWVLQRLAAGLSVSPGDIMGLGVGGLLAEIPSRPQPRAGRSADGAGPAAASPRIAALVLAAGQSRRMGDANKLLSPVDGRPMVAHAVDAALASRADPVVVVTGHEAEQVANALADRTVTRVHNPDYAAGLSRSLQAGLAALPTDIDGVVICLGDMPRVSAAVIDRLVAAFSPLEGRGIVVPTHEGRRGNPLIWARAYFAEMASLDGDVGARPLLRRHGDQVAEVPVDDPAVLLDVDTQAMLRAVTGPPADAP